jgi:hypothetical protein
MSISPDQHRRMEKLSSLPLDHPQRQEFVASLSRLDEATQTEWFALVRETEVLRAVLHQIEPPADLQANLLSIPDQIPPTIKPSWTAVRVPWPLAAAMLLVVVGIGGYVYWQQDQPSTPTYVALPAAPQGAVDAITLLAVNNHLNAAPLDVQSSDREAVRAALQTKIGKEMPFPVIIPDPGATYRLLGGSIRAFGSAKAVETRWQSKDHLYTLLQFAPADVGMPHQFATLRESPPTQQLAMANYSVAIWPGTPDGVCTWAVVSDRKAGPDPFSAGAY